MPDTLYDWMRWAGGAVCHQLSDRSLSANGRPLPLCVRCTGVYLSLFITAVGLGLSTRFRRKSRKSCGRAAFLGTAIPVALVFLPMEIDGIGNVLGLWGSNALVRMITGALFGFGLPVFFMLILTYNGLRFEHPGGSPGVLCALLALSMSGTLALYSNPSLWVGVVLIVSIWMTLAGCIYMLLAIGLKKRGLLYAALSFATACVYIGCAATLRKTWS